MNAIPPKAFISHSSLDKERFVMGFANSLRLNGVDAWLDKWEMLPGDSLVDKIFESGIKDASVFIVVISINSCDSQWVKEELNAAVVKKISGKCKLVPVLIDDCEVPEALKSTLYEKIENLANYEASLQRILISIFDASSKPPIGHAPSYIHNRMNLGADLSEFDAHVLKICCEVEIDNDSSLVQGKNLVDYAEREGMIIDNVIDSLDVLQHCGYVELKKFMGGGVPLVSVSVSGYLAFCRSYISDFDEVLRDVCVCIASGELSDSISVASKFNIPHRVSVFVIDYLEDRGYVRTSKEIGRVRRIWQVTPMLKRAVS
ncbi:toll/interleukin-1 receptor domain-containing protein [Azospirillum brasilense]|uniref:toll/interleukin-1 receptor domain-containing protein n=1 Tax=Azospirillum brasilense TaxID=192 RepID=UPI000E0B90F4|nr:toll/interleukin-1 receptor domain-containing protein [Azospirillum brasilense]